MGRHRVVASLVGGGVGEESRVGGAVGGGAGKGSLGLV